MNSRVKRFQGIKIREWFIVCYLAGSISGKEQVLPTEWMLEVLSKEEKRYKAQSHVIMFQVNQYKYQDKYFPIITIKQVQEMFMCLQHTRKLYMH